MFGCGVAQTRHLAQRKPHHRTFRSGWPGHGYSTDFKIGHNKIWAEVTLGRERRIVFNQNWLEGFQTDLGKVESQRGLLSIVLPAGQHRVELTYRPKNILLGLAASAIALVFWSLVFFRGRRQAGEQRH